MLIFTLTIMSNITFNDNPAVSALREYRGVDWTASTRAPDELTIATCNVNGMKSNVHKVRKIARILDSDDHLDTLPAVSLIGLTRNNRAADTNTTARAVDTAVWRLGPDT